MDQDRRAIEMGLSFVLWQRARALASRASIVSYLIFLSPPVSLCLLHGIVGEPFEASTVVGLVGILAGLAAQQWMGCGARLARAQE